MNTSTLNKTVIRLFTLGLSAFLLGMPAVLSGQTFEDRATIILEALEGRELVSPGGSGKLPYGTAVARLLADPGHEQALAYIAGAGMGGEPPFNGLYMIRGYLTAPDSFSPSQAAMIQAHGEGVNEYNMDYTENHKVLLWAIGYLMAQSFPDGTWIWNGSAVDSDTLMNGVRSIIRDYGQAVFDRGYSDLLSPTYDLFKVAAWISLYDLAEEPVVRDMADAMLNYHLTLLALGSRDEVILPPYSRGVGSILDNAFASDSQWLNWLFWGHGGSSPETAVRGSMPEWIVAMSDWRPHATIDDIATGEVEVPYGFQTQQPFFFAGDPLHMMRTSYRDSGYSISSGVYRMDLDGLDVHGARQVVHDDAFAIAWDSESPVRYLSVMHPYWNSDSGPTDWSSRNSPFMQVVQARNTAIVAFDIPAEDPWTDVEPWAGTRAEDLLPVGLIRWPTSGVGYDGGWGDNWISLDTGSAYIAIKVLRDEWRRDRRALMSQGFQVVESEGTVGERWKTGFIFEAGNAADYESLEAFMAAVMANPVEIDLDAFNVRYTSTLGDELDMTFTVSLEVPEFSVPGFTLNGELVDFSEWPHMESPWTNLEGQVLSVATADPEEVAVVDWSGTYPVMEVRTVEEPTDPPEPTDWADYPISDNGWVNTGDFLGWIFPDEAGYVLVYSMGRYIYLPEEAVGPSGGWAYIR
jgi:hypothetical protein